MKKTLSKIVSMVLTVFLLFGMTSLTTFAAELNFDDYAGALDTELVKSTTIGNWIVNDNPKYLSMAIVEQPGNVTNKVLRLDGKTHSYTRNPSGLTNKSSFGTNTGEDSIKFRLARATDVSKQMNFSIRTAASSSKWIHFTFDMKNGKVTCDTAIAPSPANNVLYFADYVNKSVPVNTWVDIEIRLLGSPATRSVMIYADGNPLVYSSDATDGSILAGENMTPLVFEEGTWGNNAVNYMNFWLEPALDTDPAGDNSSFYLDDIDYCALSEDEKACSLTMINYIAPVMDEYSAAIASSPIINTDMVLPTNNSYGATTVTWSSETEGVTVQNNKVILPNADDVTEATLTATATRGDATFSQSWTVKLAPRIKASITETTVADGELKSVTINKSFELPESAKILVGVYSDTTKQLSNLVVLTPAAASGSETINLATPIAVAEDEFVKAFVLNMDTLEPLAK